MDNHIIKIKNLCKSYYTLDGEITAIKGVSFNVNKGRFISIIGSSGCGKSTLLNILAGLDKHTSGSIIFHKKKPQIGYMLQEHALLPWLTIYENAILGLKLRKIDNEENKNHVLDLLKNYGLNDFINKYPSEISGGMKQRVACLL